MVFLESSDEQDSLEDILPTLEVILEDCRCPSEHSKVRQEQPHVVFTLLASKSSQALISANDVVEQS